MTVMMEAIGAELAIRAALNQVIKHIASTVLDSNLRQLEDEATFIEDASMRLGYLRALASLQREPT